METIYRERDEKVETIMTGSQIWAAGYMGVEVSVKGHVQKWYELEANFRHSQRKWNVKLSYYAGQSDPDINVINPVFK